MKLNLGCGENPMEGFVNVDFFKTDATVLCNLNKPNWDFKNKSVDFINSDFVLEHIRNLDIFVDECYRILKNGGKIKTKCDYAGYFLLYVSKNHEHNKMLYRNYDFVEKGDERIFSDSHCHLFVESHLRHIFSKFGNIKITYPSPNRSKFRNFMLNLLPYHLGKQHIQIEAEKLNSLSESSEGDKDGK